MKKALITYATWTGSTREVAEEIGRVLERQNIEVEIVNAKSVKNMDGYDLILMGTSIHASKTVGAFKKLIKRFFRDLKSKKVAYFVVCANMIEDSEENRSETKEWLKKEIRKYKEIKPIAIGLFGGAIQTEGDEYQKLFYPIRKIIDAMKEKMIEEYGKSDFRDWEKIHDWAMMIAEKLRTE